MLRNRSLLTAVLVGLAATAAVACGPPPPPAGTPIGSLDVATPEPGGVRLKGWTIDPDTSAPTNIHVYRDGQVLSGHTANGARPDLAGPYPSSGTAHGFDVVLPPAADGDHEYCVYAINVTGGGANPLLGCSVVKYSSTPDGFFDRIGPEPASGGVRITGWLIDFDTTQPASITATVDGVPTAFVANQSRPDIGAAYPAYGANHGFNGIIPITGPFDELCIIIENVDGTAGQDFVDCASSGLFSASGLDHGEATDSAQAAVRSPFSDVLDRVTDAASH